MGGKNNKQFIITLILVFIFVAFIFNFDESVTGSSIRTLNKGISASSTGINSNAAPGRPQSNIMCVNDIPDPIGKSFAICSDFVFSKEYDVIKDDVTIICKNNAVISYDSSNPPAAHNAFNILEGIKNVKIQDCHFEGLFKETINNAGEYTKINNNYFFNSNIAIKEKDTARQGFYVSNEIMLVEDTGIILHGINGLISDSLITDAKTAGIQVGEWMENTTTDPDAICTKSSDYPVYCSIPSLGLDAAIVGNEIKDNEIGINVIALGTNIIYNEITNNIHDGILVRAIFAGSEKNYWGYLMEHMQSGFNIKDNLISGNSQNNGVRLVGRATHEYTINYYRISHIENNNISNNEKGIIMGGFDDEKYNMWNEATIIINNSISYNKKEGIHLNHGGMETDILNNDIAYNKGNGILLGSPQFDNKFIGYSNFIYDNNIVSNEGNGISVEGGWIFKTVLNEINNNFKNGIYAFSYTSHEQLSSYMPIVECNDISYNKEHGVNIGVIDIQLSHHPTNLLFNRIINNNLNGIFYSGSIQGSISKFIINEISGNGLYGANLSGIRGTFIASNNIYNNQQGLAKDLGPINNMWDEEQYESFFNHESCACNISCNIDWDCGYLSKCENNICVCNNPMTCGSDNTCGCYVYYNQNLSSERLGNYLEANPPVYEINMDSPPLLSCSVNEDCPYLNCYNGVCGNYDAITSQSKFSGYYGSPGFDPSVCHKYYPPNPPWGYCGDGYWDWANEECDPEAKPTGCGFGEICTDRCICKKENIPPYNPDNYNNNTPPPPPPLI